VFSDAIEIAVAVVGLGMVALAVKQARAKGWAGSLQMAAGGFLLMGAAAVGVVEFVAGLVFSPLAWAGVGMLALSAVLFMAGQKLEAPSGKKAVADSPGKSKPKGQVTPSPKDKGAAGEFDEIEDILRRHGIQ
jgi:hypothetical protein